MFDEAVYLALQKNSVPLMSLTRQFAEKKRNLMIINLIDFHKEQIDKENGTTTQSSLTRSMS